MNIAVTIDSDPSHHPKARWIGIGLIALLCTTSFSLNKDTLRSDTLAIIGDKIITSDRFIKLFREKLVETGLTDNGSARLGYLSNLVDDEILIAQAKKEKLDRTKESLQTKKEIELQELLNAYLEKHITAVIRVTEDDLADLFVRMNTKIKASHIFAQTKIAADSLFEELSIGKSFHEIAARTFTDPRLRDHGGSLGYFSVDEMDPEFEKTAYAMHIGEISKPVKTVQGYSIIKIDDIQKNPFVTESEFLKVREKLKGFARKRKIDESVKRYTERLRKDLHIRFNDSYVTKLYQMTQRESFQEMGEKRSNSFSQTEYAKTMLTSIMGTWSVKEAVDALSRTKERQRNWIHTKENFEDVLAGLVLQEYISRTAKKEKLDSTPSLRKNVNDAFDTYLLTKIEDRLKKQEVIVPDSLKSFYLGHLENFTTPPEMRISAILVDDVSMTDTIQQLLKQGVSFAELAKKYSVQKLTAEQGGDLGFFRKEELGKLGEQLLLLQTGEWVGPVPGEQKYLFVKCTDRKDAVQRSFDESSKEIEAMLLSLAWTNARSQHIESCKKNIGCLIYPDRLMAITLN